MTLTRWFPEAICLIAWTVRGFVDRMVDQNEFVQMRSSGGDDQLRRCVQQRGGVL